MISVFLRIVQSKPIVLHQIFHYLTSTATKMKLYRAMLLLKESCCFDTDSPAILYTLEILLQSYNSFLYCHVDFLANLIMDFRLVFKDSEIE